MSAGDSRTKAFSTTFALPFIVFIDMFAVSLVVPLLFQYYKQAGINSASQREWLSSLFSSSQIIGGILMGIITDAKLVTRQTLLYVSFVGSALSYGLIVCGGGLPALVVSRITVGLVKQTMTITTTMTTHATLPAQRGKAIGRLTAASTVAWIVGPTGGALLFKYIHPSAPALIACILFFFNLLLAMVLLPTPQQWRIIEARYVELNSQATNHADEKKKEKRQFTIASVVKNFQVVFSSRTLGAVVVSRLLYTFVMRTTSFSQLGSFYEDMYGLEAHHRGFISSYQQFVSFVVQAALVGPLVAWSGGERQSAAFLAVVLAINFSVESLRSLWLFLLLLCPIKSLCLSMINLALQTLTTQVAPSHAIFSVLTSLDILQSVASVSAPLYRSFLFRFLASDEHASGMVGDPDPVTWVITCAIHWGVAALVMLTLLVFSSHWWNDAEQGKLKEQNKQK
jgi:MFS family permease